MTPQQTNRHFLSAIYQKIKSIKTYLVKTAIDHTLTLYSGHYEFCQISTRNSLVVSVIVDFHTPPGINKNPELN
jgi:hypothetical protein